MQLKEIQQEKLDSDLEVPAVHSQLPSWTKEEAASLKATQTKEIPALLWIDLMNPFRIPVPLCITLSVMMN